MMRDRRQAAWRTPRRRRDEDAGILPLVNVVFLLLIFFIVAGELAASDPFPITPTESASETPAAPGRLIAFGAGGTLALDGVVMDEAALLATLDEALAREPATEIRIKADGRADATALVALLGSLREIGAATVTLMTVPEAP